VHAERILGLILESYEVYKKSTLISQGKNKTQS